MAERTTAAEGPDLASVALGAVGLVVWFLGAVWPSMGRLTPTTWESRYLSGLAVAVTGTVLVVAAAWRVRRDDSLHRRLLLVVAAALFSLALHLATDASLVGDLRWGPRLTTDAELSLAPSDCAEGTGCTEVHVRSAAWSEAFVLEPRNARAWREAADRCPGGRFARLTWLPVTLELLEARCGG